MNIKKSKIYKNITYIWCCDMNINSGEGILANKFIKDFKNANPNNFLKIKTPKFNKNLNFITRNIDRFVNPMLGVIYLWKKYIKNRNVKLCYINYLPLWNFLIFALLPPKTIIGPITGGSIYLKKPFTNYLIRKYIFNFLYTISKYILILRKNKLLFSTNLLKYKFKNNKNVFFNYVLKDIKLKKTNKKKEIDLLLYIRKHDNKNSGLQIKIALELCKKFKVATVGDRINNNLITNYGFITRKKLINKLKKTKISILSSENLYSFFAIDCVTSGVLVIYNKFNRNEDKIFFNKSVPVNYNNLNLTVKKIKKILTNYRYNRNTKIYFKDKFKDYFLK